MKKVTVIFLVVSIGVLGFATFSLQEELVKERESVKFYMGKNRELEKDLVLLRQKYNKTRQVLERKKQILEKIKNNLTELENRVDLDRLEKYVPDETWEELSPVIDRLRRLKED